MMSLAADIGGTYSRLAWSGDAVAAAGAEQAFNNADFPSLEAVIDRALAEQGCAGRSIDSMVLAVPGPVRGDTVKLTNIDWTLHRGTLQQRYRTSRLVIVNDFQAAALGASAEPFEHLKQLNAATPDNGPVVVAGAGTGLGMAWLPRADLSDLPVATEGGHLDFAPNNAAELELYRWLGERYGHVSYERILSGDGLLDTYRFVAGDTAPAQSPQQINGLAGRGDSHATAAIRLFVDVFASYAGNLALAFNPTGGIYLCGGLAAHLAAWFDPPVFGLRFAAKGRMSDVVRRIPVFLVTRHGSGLHGAKLILERSTGAET